MQTSAISEKKIRSGDVERYFFELAQCVPIANSKFSAEKYWTPWMKNLYAGTSNCTYRIEQSSVLD